MIGSNKMKAFGEFLQRWNIKKPMLIRERSDKINQEKLKDQRIKQSICPVI